MSRQATAGFTLLEILIAVALTALLVSTAVQVYLQIGNAQLRVRNQEGREHVAQVLLDRIERELMGTLLVVKPEGEDRLSDPYVFVGEDRVLGDADADAIRFVTLTPARHLGQHAGAGIRMVSYGVAPRPDGGLDLLRREEPLPRGMDTRIQVEEGQTVVEQLALFSLRYLDEETGEWEDRWDSTDIARLDRLPEQVEIHVQLLRRAANRDLVAGREVQREVRLPIRPIQPSPPPPAEGGEGPGDAAPEPNAPGS